MEMRLSRAAWGGGDGRRRRRRSCGRTTRTLRGEVRRGLRVVVVEARTLEDDAHRVEQLAELAAALLAHGQGIVIERLANVELVSACGAAIRIGRHASSFRCHLSNRYSSDWHSSFPSANFTRTSDPRPDSFAASWQDHISGILTRFRDCHATASFSMNSHGTQRSGRTT